jgi:hypothetical protein
MVAWLLLVLALFAVPLQAFTRPLALLKQRTPFEAAAQATRFHRLAERKLLESNVFVDSAESYSDDMRADPSKHYEAARQLSVFLLNRSALIPIMAAAILPLAAVGATKLPYKEVVTVVKSFCSCRYAC